MLNDKKFLPFLGLDKRGCLMGAGSAAVVMALCGAFFSWRAGVLFAGLFFLAGAVKLRIPDGPVGLALNALFAGGMVLASCAFPTMMLNAGNFLELGFFLVLMNALCVAMVYCVFVAVTGRFKLGTVLASGALLVMTTVNTALFHFRGNELRPLDILSVGTALNVAGQYSLQVTAIMAYIWLIWLWMVLCLLHVLPKATVSSRARLRVSSAVAAMLCGVTVWRCTLDLTTRTWSNTGTVRNGYFLNFFTGIRDSYVEAPEGYTPTQVQELSDRYPAAETTSAGLPNILVIMNESFADFGTVGEDLRTNIPVTPFVDSLRENTIRGHALVSVFGGNTANSEYEFLTGGSMANLPDASVPYQQYITGNTYSLAWLMEELGYRTVATHPYRSSGWNRTTAYPRLGFSEMTFSEAYPQEDMIRNYISDREMYEYVLQLLEEPGDEPLFLFGITIQNHGGYQYSGDNYQQTVRLEGYDGDYPLAEQYLTLLHESDQAVEYLLSELAEYPQDTIVVFFGDHFPAVEDEFFWEVHGDKLRTLPERLQKYNTPFFIWANFDIQERDGLQISLGYLGRYLLEVAGVELPPYYQFLKELEQAIPAVSSRGYYSVSQQTYLPLESAQGEEAQWLDAYAFVQYNSLFDQRSLNEAFFGAYLP